MDTADVFAAVRAAVVEVGGEKGENKQNKSRRESTFIRGRAWGVGGQDEMFHSK